MPDQKASVGEKIKILRVTKGMSLEEVSRKSGISGTNLAKFENDELTPPLGNVVNLAQVFEVSVGDIFGDSGDSPFAIVRVGDRTAVSRFGSAYVQSTAYSYQGLGQQKRNRQMEPFIVTLNPAATHAVEPNEHIGEEFIFVLEGRVEVTLLDHRDVLNPGDSIYYDSMLPHIVACHGDKPATILAVIYAKREMIIL